MALWKESTQKGLLSKGAESVETNFSPDEPPSRDLNTVKSNSKESFLSSGLTFEGKIDGEGDVRVGGRFKGDVRVSGDLTIESGAHITGEIGAENVTIGGEVEGNIAAAAQVKLLASGQLVGDLKATSLTVVAGSRMRGNVEFGWDDQKSKTVGVEKLTDKRGNGSSL